MMKRLRMAEQWSEFSKHIIPSDAPQVQKQEMRRAFYAGAAAYQSILVTEVSINSEMTDADLKLADDLDEELKAFAFMVLDGRA